MNLLLIIFAAFQTLGGSGAIGGKAALNKGAGSGCYAGKLVSTFTPGGSRHNFTAELGFRFTVGGASLSVNCLGRYVSSPTHSQTHTVKLWDSSNTVIASVAIDVTGGTTGTWMFASITPVTLTSGQTYRLTSTETDTLDDWQNSSTFTYPAAINTVNATYGDPPPGWTNANTDQQYVGVDLNYQ